MLTMWLFRTAKADAEPNPIDTPAAELVAEPIATVAEEITVEETEGKPAEPEAEAPPKMPHQPTASEIEAVKEEIVQEMVEKVLEVEGAVVPTLKTAPYDPRFPTTNQSRHCFIRYNEYYKCVFERSAEDDRCQFYKDAYESLCPPDWVEEWEELRSQGLWFGKY